jgi:UPF0716 family protein affecting phage T7 exclusion
LTLANGSAPHATLVMLVAVAVAAALLVVPGFLLLFWLHGRQLLNPTAPPIRHAEQTRSTTPSP